MLVTDDVVWSLADFVVAGILLAAIGVVLELAVRRTGNPVTSLGIADRTSLQDEADAISYGREWRTFRLPILAQYWGARIKR